MEPIEKKEKKFIDVEELFRSKNPKMLKVIPSFVLNYIKKIVHQDELNAFMKKHENDNAYEFCRGVIEDFNITLESYGVENIPTSGRVIVASNHPLGGMDAMSAITLIEPKRKDVMFIANDLLLNLKNLREIFTGVNKLGKNARNSLQGVNELFSSDKLIFVFPAGLVSRKIDGKIMDLEWKKTFITRSRKFNTPILPVYIEGSLTKRFYRIAKIRKFFGIKANIEMLYLSDELHRQKNKHIKIIFGEVIPAATFDKSKTDVQWAETVKQIAYKLPEKYSKK